MKLSKNIISNIRTDYNKIKPKNVSKPNNHKKPQKVTVALSGGAALSYDGMEFDSPTGGTDTNAQTSDNSFSASLSETTDGGMTISSSLELDDGQGDSGNLDAGFSIAFTDGSIINAGTASDDAAGMAAGMAYDFAAPEAAADIAGTTMAVTEGGDLDFGQSYLLAGAAPAMAAVLAETNPELAVEAAAAMAEANPTATGDIAGDNITLDSPDDSMSFMTVNTKNYDSKIISGIESNSDTTTPITIENNGKIVNNGTMKNIKQISGSGDIVLNNANVTSFEVESHPDAHFIFNTLNSYLHHNRYLKHFNSQIESNKKIYKLNKLNNLEPTLFFGKYKTNHKTTVIISPKYKPNTGSTVLTEILNLQNNNLIVGINLINRSSIILPEKSFLSFYKSSNSNHKLNLINQNNGSLRYYYNPNYNNSTETVYYSYGFNNEAFENKREENSNFDQIDFGNIRRITEKEEIITVNYIKDNIGSGISYQTVADDSDYSATTNENFGISYAMSDDFSIGYYASDTSATSATGGAGAASDDSDFAISASYTSGGLSLKPEN